MLYASELKGDKFVYVNEIVKIEDDYRNGDVKDIYENGISSLKIMVFLTLGYNRIISKAKALTKEQLKEIKMKIPVSSSIVFRRY